MTVLPDWVCEILSPGHERKDTITHFLQLQRAGVPYYWIIDPGDWVLIVYALHDGRYRTVFTASRPCPTCARRTFGATRSPRAVNTPRAACPSTTSFPTARAPGLLHPGGIQPLRAAAGDRRQRPLASPARLDRGRATRRGGGRTRRGRGRRAPAGRSGTGSVARADRALHRLSILVLPVEVIRSGCRRPCEASIHRPAGAPRRLRLDTGRWSGRDGRLWPTSAAGAPSPSGC